MYCTNERLVEHADADGPVRVSTINGSNRRSEGVQPERRKEAKGAHLMRPWRRGGEELGRGDAGGGAVFGRTTKHQAALRRSHVQHGYSEVW